MINDLESILKAGQVVLVIARRLEAEGKFEDAKKMYLRAIAHGHAVAKIRSEAQSLQAQLEPVDKDHS